LDGANAGGETGVHTAPDKNRAQMMTFRYPTKNLITLDYILNFYKTQSI